MSLGCLGLEACIGVVVIGVSPVLVVVALEDVTASLGIVVPDIYFKASSLLFTVGVLGIIAALGIVLFL